MRREVLALAGKDVRLLMRDKGGAFVTFVFPLIYCVFFGLIFAARNTTGSAIGIVVVDEDRSERSATFVERLEAAEEFAVTYAGRGEAVDLVRRGEQIAYVVLPEGFGETAGKILLNQRPRIEVGVDPARQAEAAMIKGMLTRYAFAMITSSFSEPKVLNQYVETARAMLQNDERLGIARRAVYDRFFVELDRFVEQVSASHSENGAGAGSDARDNGSLAGWQPIEVTVAEVAREREGPSNSYEISFPQGIIWGVLGCCASFGISLVIERTSGTLARLRLAPIGRHQIVAGKALACFGSTVSLAIVLFLVGWLVFDVRPHSILHLGVSLVLIATAFVGIMMFLSILGKTERSVSGISWAVLLGMAMIGGGMVPRFFMPQWMQTLSHISPVKWAILAMEGAVWRNFTTSEMLLPWAILLGVGVVFFTIGVRGFAWMDEG